MSIKSDAVAVQSATVLENPPVVSYFQVTFFPGYMNDFRLAKVAATTITHLRVEEAAIFFSLLGLVQDSIRDVTYTDENFKKVPSTSGINPIDIRFNKVSGLSRAIETQDIRVGGFNSEMLQLPDRVVHSNLVLERGFIAEPWSLTSREFSIAMNLFTVIPGEIVVCLNNPSGKPIAAWLYRNAYPVGWSNADLHSDDNGIFMEKMEFAYSHCHQLDLNDNGENNVYYL